MRLWQLCVPNTTRGSCVNYLLLECLKDNKAEDSKDAKSGHVKHVANQLGAFSRCFKRRRDDVSIFVKALTNVEMKRGDRGRCLRSFLFKQGCVNFHSQRPPFLFLFPLQTHWRKLEAWNGVCMFSHAAWVMKESFCFHFKRKGKYERASRDVTLQEIVKESLSCFQPTWTLVTDSTEIVKLCLKEVS